MARESDIGIELDEIRRRLSAHDDDDPLEIATTMNQPHAPQNGSAIAAAAGSCNHRNDPHALDSPTNRTPHHHHPPHHEVVPRSSQPNDNSNSSLSHRGAPPEGSGGVPSPMAPPSLSSRAATTAAVAVDNFSRAESTPRAGAGGKKQFGEVILELRGIEKSFRVDSGEEAVVALKGIHLYDSPSSTANADATTAGSASPPAVPHQGAITPPPTRTGSDYSNASAATVAAGGAPQPLPNTNNSNSSRSSATAVEVIQSFAAIRQGEFVMIRGPSGGGKTTLLNLIGTLDSPTKGEMLLLGNKIDKSTPDGKLAEIRLKHIGFVFQTFNLIATMTAAENVELPMTLVGDLNAKQRRLRARQLLSLVGLRNRIDHLPSELSGGEQQRVTIARSLANNPKILLLDEPTGDLDTATTLEVMDLLLRLNHFTKTTCIMVTHNPDVECYADRILYVSDGQFLREVVNEEPRQLVLEKYVEYLAQREKMMTTAVGRREL